MNKNLFLGMFAATTMLFATSCQNDELDGVQSGNEATVNFNLGVRNGVQTRTTNISDGKSADKLIYAVYNADKQLITTIIGSQNGQFVKDEAFANGLEENVSITLAKGQTYTAIFWAQDDDCEAYNTADLTNVIVDYAGVNNDESRDAFFGVQEFTVNGNASINVELKRPFAQMNVGVTQADWDAAVASGITISESKAKISEVPNSINLMDGTVSGAQSVEYSLKEIPTEKLYVDTDGDENKEAFVYLSMNYFLADVNKTLVDNVEFTFKPTSGKEIVLNQGLNNVPVQRNWRTNILGKFLTGDIDFNIVIVPEYDGDYNGIPFDGIINTKEELVAAARVGGEFLLAEDLTLDQSIWVPAGVEFTLNANGKSLTYNGAPDVEPYSLFCAQGVGSKLTINADENSTFETSENNMLVWARDGSQIILNGGRYIGHDDGNGGRCDIIYASYGTAWGTIEVRDGYFQADPGNDTWLFNCRWANGSSWAIQMYGGTIVGYNPALGDEQTGPNSNLPEGYIAEVTGTTEDGRNIYTVRPSTVKMNGRYYANISEAIANVAEGEELNIELADGVYTIPANAKGQTLKFIGAGDAQNTIIAIQKADNPKEPCDYGFDGSTVTFENLTIEANPIPNQYSGFVRCNGTYKNCIIKNQYTLYGTSSFENCRFYISGNKYNLWTWGASADFTKCTFDCDGKAVLVYGYGTSTVTFTECVFNDFGGVDGKAAIETGNDYDATYTIEIKDCEVNGFDVNSVSGSNVWGNKNSMTADKLNVIIDETKVY